MAGLPRLLRHPGHGGGVGRAQEVHRESWGGRLQAPARGARTLPVRAHASRRGDRPRGKRAVLAEEAGDQARGHQGRPRPHDAPRHAQDRRGRHRLPDGRPRGGDRQGGSEAASCSGHRARDVVAGIPRAVESQVTVERSPRPARGQSGHRQAGHQRGRATGILAPDGIHDSERHGIRAPPRSVSL